MTLENPHGDEPWLLSCDRCPSSKTFDARMLFRDMWDEAVDEGWKAVNVGENEANADWQHRCPACQAEIDEQDMNVRRKRASP